MTPDTPRPDETKTERAALVERITDALVEFDREQHEGYGAHGPFSDRLARIVRVNDANHAAWAVLQHYTELRAEIRESTEAINELRAENADLRRAAADELSREGQEMGLDAARPVSFTGDEVMEAVAEFNDRCERLSTGLRAMAARLTRERCEARSERRWADHYFSEWRVVRIETERLSAGLRGMARRSVANRAEATYWASGDWQAENRKLRAELATLRAGRASGAEALVDALDGALVELKRLRFSVKDKHIPYPEELDEEIARVQAVLLADPGHSPTFTAPPTDQPEVVEPGETTVVPYLPLAEYKALMRSASAPSDRPVEPDPDRVLERLAKHLCERYDANSLTWEAADKQDRWFWRHRASLALDALGADQ